MVIALPALFFLVVLVVAAKVISNALQDALLKKGNVTAGPATEFSPHTEAQTEAELRKPAPVVAPAPEPPPQPEPEADKNPGNVGPIVHVGKEKEEESCDAAWEKYPVHEYRSAKLYKKGIDFQSHHVLQNAQFWGDKKPDATVCSTYDENAAPCISILGPSNVVGTPHHTVTQMQNMASQISRTTNTPITYSDAKEKARAELSAIKLTQREIECILLMVDVMMKKMCPNMNDGTILRTPKK